MITSGHSQMQAKSDTTVPSLSPEAIIESFRHTKHEDTLIMTESLRQHHTEMLLTILKIRAATLARVADFEQALNETTIQMQIAPLSALGYLQSGDILSNMQGHQAAAINIYEKGISMVPQSDPYHQQLLQAKQQALAKQQIRVDFITQLPLTLVQNWIAPLLRGGNKWRYLGTVSKRWYQALMADNVDKKHFKVYGEADKQQLMDAAPKIISLRFKDYRQPLHILLNLGKFHSLQRLSIEDCSLSTWPEFATALHKVGTWLTHLEMEKTHGASTIFLKDILTSCPRIQSIRCIRNGNLVISDIDKHCTSLKSLQFWTNDQITKKHVVDLLTALATLEDLSIYYKETTKCLIRMDTAYDHVFSARFNHLISNFDSGRKEKRMLYIHGQGLENAQVASKLLLESHHWQPMDSYVYNTCSLESSTIYGLLKYSSPVLQLQSMSNITIIRCGLKEGYWMQVFQQWRSIKLRLDQVRLIEEPGITDAVVSNLVGSRGSVLCMRLELNSLPNITSKCVKYLYSHLYSHNIRVIDCPKV